MRKSFFIFTAVLFGFGLQNANAQNTLKGVKINGVVWATTNVGSTTHQGYGKYYTWQEAKTVCPKGWRLPTLAEAEKLLEEKKVTFRWTSFNGKNGARFTDKVTGNSIFLPAAGYHYDGKIDGVSTNGGYWSSTEHSSKGTYAYDLSFSGHVFYLYGSLKTSGESVRCVAE